MEEEEEEEEEAGGGAEQEQRRRKKQLWREVRQLSLGLHGQVDRLVGQPSPLRFLREFVLPNKPCIISHAIDHWPALSLWTSNDYLVDRLRDQQVSLHFTPHGRADSLVVPKRASSHGHAVVPMFPEPLPGVSMCGNREKNGFWNHEERLEFEEDLTCRNGLRTEIKKEKCNKGSRCGNDVNSECSRCADYGTSENSTWRDDLAYAHSRYGKGIDSKHSRDGKGIDSKHSRYDSAIYSVSDIDVERFNHSASDIDRKEDVLNQSMVVSDSIPDIDGEINQNSTSDIDEEEDTRNCMCSSQCSHYKPLEERKLKENWFATAHVERIPFPKALEFIINSSYGNGNGVAYAQEQNGCFLSEYGVLAHDAEVHIPWATEALGCMPEAVNLWIGTEKSVTSFHKDHYENLYAVVTGEKHFTLLPPTDMHRLYIREYPSAYYTKNDGEFSLQQHEPRTFVPWASVDPYPPPSEVSMAKSEFHEYFNGPKPFTCTVRAGEILYLPSMWFHHVRQSPDLSGRTIALNFWYDMQFDIKYAYYNFLASFP